jgi:hypothetical protein
MPGRSHLARNAKAKVKGKMENRKGKREKYENGNNLRLGKERVRRGQTGFGKRGVGTLAWIVPGCGSGGDGEL